MSTSVETRGISGKGIAVGAVAAGVPLLGLGFAAVAFIPELTAAPTDVSRLSISVEDSPGPAYSSWVVPVDAPWPSFPTPEAVTDPTIGCTETQLAWLSDYGIQKPDAIDIEFTNQATSGQRLSIFDVRLEGELKPSDPSILVRCADTNGGFGPVQVVSTSIRAGSDSVAVVDVDQEILEGSDVQYNPGEQVVFNLRPGDKSLLRVKFLEDADAATFVGRLLATVSSGDTSVDEEIPYPVGQLIIPTATISDAVISVSAGLAQCGRLDVSNVFFNIDFSSATPCDGTIIADRLDRGWDIAAPISLDGTWVGDVLGDTVPYSIRVTISDDGQVAAATVEYPELPCSGTWSQVSRAPETVSFLEDVPAGSICFDNVPVSVRVSGEVLEYEALSGGRTITATLTRSP